MIDARCKLAETRIGAGALLRALKSLGIAIAVGVAVLVLVSAYEVVQTKPSTSSSCTDCVKATVPTGSGYGSAGNDIAYDSANGNLFVSSSDQYSWSVTVINGSTDTVSTVVTDTGRPLALAYDSSNGDVYVANWIGNNVTVIDGRSDAILTSIELPPQNFSAGGGPYNILYNPFNGFLDVVEYDPAYLVQIDGSTNQVAGYTPYWDYDDVLTANPTDGNLYAAVNTTAAPFPTGEPRFDLDVLSGSTLSVVSSLPMNGSPAALAYDSQNDQLFLAGSTRGYPEYYNGSVTEFNSAATKVEAVTSIGQLPTGIALDAANGNLYATNYYSANISVVNATNLRATGSIPVAYSAGPIGPIVYDARNQCLYTVAIEGLVSIISPPGGTCPLPPASTPGLTAGGLAVAGSLGTVAAASVFIGLRVRQRPR
jgi:DNA-binding beta-propeller fold protein YncE